jgi:hypothetical protein
MLLLFKKIHIYYIVEKKMGNIFAADQQRKQLPTNVAESQRQYDDRVIELKMQLLAITDKSTGPGYSSVQKQKDIETLEGQIAALHRVIKYQLPALAKLEGRTTETNVYTCPNLNCGQQNIGRDYRRIAPGQMMGNMSFKQGNGNQCVTTADIIDTTGDKWSTRKQVKMNLNYTCNDNLAWQLESTDEVENYLGRKAY